MKLNLTAADSSQEKILAYLLENTSESLANKINNGTPFTKDNVQLINKKDLTTFMSYATTEARKLATNGASYTCIDDATVFGWAIHYFEEESIEGKLYNLDGTEYKTVSATTTKQKSFIAPTTKVEPPKLQQEQRSLFDILEATTTEPVESNASVDTTPTVESVTAQAYKTVQAEIEPITTPILEPTTEPILDTSNIDIDTGEILEPVPVTEPVEETKTTQPVKQEQQTPTFDRETMIYLVTLLDNKIEIA